MFDGGNAIIDGNLIINADYIALKNLTVNKDVIVTADVDDFFADGLVTNGELVIEDEKGEIASLIRAYAFLMPNTNGPTIELTNSSINAVNAKRDKVVLTSNTKLPVVKVSENVSAIQVNADVEKVAINVFGNLNITGNSTINKIDVGQVAELTLDVSGQVNELAVVNNNAVVTVGQNVAIEKVVVPKDSDVESIILNYDWVKDNISGVVDDSGAEVSADPTKLNVSDLQQLKTALADETIKTINITKDIVNVPERIVVDRAVTINGGGHTISFTEDINALPYGSRHGLAVMADDVTINDLLVSLTKANEWQGAYAVQVYNAQNVKLNNFTGTGADAALLVNGSKVELTGTTTVSGNEFGGIEVSQGTDVENAAQLTVTGTILNTTEQYAQPSIWVVNGQGTVDGVNKPTVENTEIKADQTQYYLSEETATTVNVASVEELKAALDNSTIKAINLSDSFTTSETIVVNRPVAINGGNHTIAFEGDVKETWNSNYVFQVYNTSDVTISDVKLTSGDAGLLVNGSAVKLQGVIDVSGNEFGGIEVSMGSGLTTKPTLDVTNGTVFNTTEAYGLPTIWEDDVIDSVVAVENAFTSNDSVKDNQVQYYLNKDNAVDQTSIANVASVEELKAALANEEIETINLTADLNEVAERIVVDRAVTINGQGHLIGFTDNINTLPYGTRQGIAVVADGVVINDLTVQLTDAAEWQGVYAIQVYDAVDVTLNNFTGTGADSALLVNASEVELTGTTTVSGNEFGGIEVSKGALEGLSNSLLNVTGTIANETESYGEPTIWLVHNQDEAKTAQGTVTGDVAFSSTINYIEKADGYQTQYYLADAPVKLLSVVQSASYESSPIQYQLEIAAQSQQDLYELEVDHNIASLPEFSVYADEVNPYGSEEAKSQFEALGVTVTYNAATKTWTINFGPQVSSDLVAQGQATFYFSIADKNGYAFGTMYGTTNLNTYTFDF